MFSVTFRIVTPAGVGAAKRKLASSASPTIEIQFDGKTFTQTTITDVKTKTVSCNLGEEFEYTFEQLGVTKKVNVCSLLKKYC